MSLVNKLMSVQESNINTARYGHDSAASIAMESAAELYDIFRTGFYAAEQAELGAVSEGVALEASQFQAVLEGAIKDGIAKIGKFLRDLAAKVKAFFDGVRKFIDSIVMSGKDFAKKYETELGKLTNLKDFEYRMYNYDDEFIDKTFPDKVQGAIDSTFNSLTGEVDNVIGRVAEGHSKASVDKNDQGGAVDTKDYSEDLKSLKKTFEDEFKSLIKETINASDEDEIAKNVFAKFRSGANDDSDKSEVKPEIGKIVATLKDAKSTAKIDEMIRKSNAAFAKAIAFVDSWANKADKMSGAGVKTGSAIAEGLRIYSSHISKVQTFSNTMTAAWKSVISERSNVYKSCLMAAMSYDKKEAGKK